MGEKKKKTIYVCFDTCALVDCAFSSRPDTPSDLLVTIFNKMEQCGAKLLAPEVIEAELGAVVERRKGLMDCEVAAIKREIEESPSLGAGSKRLLSDSIDKARDAIRSNAESVEKMIRGKIDDEEFCERVVFGEQEICTAVRLALANARPSKAKHGEGLLQADCLIVSCIGSFIERNKNCEVVLCSSNTKDFAQQIGGEWQLADSIKTCLGDVRYYAKPSDLLKNELDLTDEEEEEVEALDEEYDRLVASYSVADILGIQTAQTSALAEALRESLGPQEAYMSSIASVLEKYQNIAPQNTYASIAQTIQNAMPDLSSYFASLRTNSAISEAANLISRHWAVTLSENEAVAAALREATVTSSLSSSLARAARLSSMTDSVVVESAKDDIAAKSTPINLGNTSVVGDLGASIVDAEGKTSVDELCSEILEEADPAFEADNKNDDAK